eukprot:CAMPEP_0183810284 /NCGR_PEP_ID=MMETSP0803_2-20130417/47080_1 /TAXON_ID=195967 /ORGANISM="Crustomastix stigmata, Strain CCMP3273" /LENGTH=83 /DNA_ID=CAMNT_0026055097 /DNA_START=223 /DNA_END=471 /DNA_ORIENTATION=-
MIVASEPKSVSCISTRPSGLVAPRLTQGKAGYPEQPPNVSSPLGASLSSVTLSKGAMFTSLPVYADAIARTTGSGTGSSGTSK